MNLHALAASPMPRTVMGLPSVGLSARDRRDVSLRGRNLGATRTTLGGKEVQPLAVIVAGQPSIRMVREEDGGVATVLRRNIQHADLLSPADLDRITGIARGIPVEARAMSQGGLSSGALAKMGHPYGRGKRGQRGRLGYLQGRQLARAGVSNMSIVNKQSGEFARSWEMQIIRDKNGLTFVLRNTSKVAQYLALGTLRMKAHGPFVVAMVRALPQLNNAVLQVANVAASRYRTLESMGVMRSG